MFKELGDHRVDVEVQIFEGDKFYLGRLEVQGNTMTRDKVIRREFALDEGDVMDMEAVKKSVTKIQQLGYFKMTEEPQFGVRPEEKKVDIVIKGQETSRNEIQFGAGYSGFDGFFGQFSFQTRNFLGRGEIIGASAQLGKVSNFFDLSYTVPWFMDRNQSVGGVALPPATSTTSRMKRSGRAARCSTRRAWPSSTRVSMLYAYEDIKANFPVRSAPVPPGQPEPPQKFTETTGTDLVAHAGVPLRQPQRPVRSDAGVPPLRDRPAARRPSSGDERRSSSRSAAPTVYIPVRLPRGAIVALNLEAGYVADVRRRRDPDFRALPARAASRASAGSSRARPCRVDPDTTAGLHRPLRPDPRRQQVLRAERRVPVPDQSARPSCWPSSTWARTTTTRRASRSRNVRSSAGAELRIFLPIFQAPLRFIYAFNLHPDQPVDQFGFPIGYLAEKPSGFTFSIGRTF